MLEKNSKSANIVALRAELITCKRINSQDNEKHRVF